MPNKISYTEASAELQQIVEELENSEIDIDLLEAKVKRASVLLKICRDKLYNSEQNVLKALKTIDGNKKF